MRLWRNYKNEILAIQNVRLTIYKNTVNSVNTTSTNLQSRIQLENNECSTQQSRRLRHCYNLANRRTLKSRNVSEFAGGRKLGRYSYRQCRQSKQGQWRSNIGNSVEIRRSRDFQISCDVSPAAGTRAAFVLPSPPP